MEFNFLTRAQLPLLRFGWSIQEYHKLGSIPLDPLCNSWTIQNLGDIWIQVNGALVKGYPVGHPELTGGAIGVSGNFGEVGISKLQVTSAQSTTGSGTTELLFLVIQKIYAFD